MSSYRRCAAAAGLLLVALCPVPPLGLFAAPMNAGTRSVAPKDGYFLYGHRISSPDNSGIPRTRADTSGSGTFKGKGGSYRVTRGWVDTNGAPTVALSGDNGFTIAFYGNANWVGERDFVLQIIDSNRGRASGTASVRLSKDKNEVESIKVSGRMEGDRFSASFSGR